MLTEIVYHAWTAGQRVNLTNTPSSYFWQVQTANRRLYKLPITVDAWAPSEPKDINDFCILLSKDFGYRWVDGHCGWGGANPLCEIDIA